VVNARRKLLVGAHFGLADWIAQRLTAVVMIAYTALWLIILLWNGGLDYPQWKALWAHDGFRAASFLFMVCLLWHAWVGVRNISIDYVKPFAIRIALQAVVIALLIAYLGWTIGILWGGR
jgi:succinate dehydrogenase / fumarate reductase membrane anchor subunit